MTNAELAERQAEVAAAETARRRDTVALLAAAEVALNRGDYLGCDTLLADGWDDIWDGLAYPAALARERRGMQHRLTLGVGEVLMGLPWAPAPTRPEVDLLCPSCRRECATVSGHLRGNPECWGAVAAMGYLTSGGSIGTDFPIALHTPYPAEVPEVPRRRGAQPDPASPNLGTEVDGTAPDKQPRGTQPRVPRQPQPRRRQPRNPGRQGAML